jgi:hypothetical protein
MSTLSSSSTFTIGAGSVVTETVPIPILPLISPGTGLGRLIHPTLGTLDYDYSPDEWVNLDQDVIIAPTWSTQKTLQGAINTLWQGDIRDVIVEEHWINDPNVSATWLRHVLAFWQNPPDPVTGTPVQWWPNYATTLGFQVIMINVCVGSGLKNIRERYDGTVLNHYANDDNWVTEPVTLTMRILGRAP